MMDLQAYLLPLRRWWWLLLASTLLASLASYLVLARQPPVYRTGASLLLGRALQDPNPANNDLWLTQQLANTYINLAQRSAIRQSTMEALSLAWLPPYDVRLVPNTQLIEISVIDTSPARAQAVANELANQLILRSPTSVGAEEQQRQAFVNEQLLGLEQNILETEQELGRREAELGSLFGAREIVDAETQIAALEAKLGTLQSNYATLLANTQDGAVNSLHVVEVASLPQFPTAPQKLSTILLAAALGLCLAGGSAYLLEYLDDTFKNPDDVQQRLGLTTLGAVPAFEDVDDEELIVISRQHTQVAEAYRILRTHFQSKSIDQPSYVLLITSSGVGEGKTRIAADFGAALAQAGKRVVLIDADLRRPRQHQFFQIPKGNGLTTALLADDVVDVEEYLVETPVPGFRVMVAGPRSSNPAELLGTERMRALLDHLRQIADVIILDTPPTTALADAAVLSSYADGVLLVVDVTKARRDLVQRAVQGLQQVSAPIIGVLLNRMPTRDPRYFYYYNYQSDYYSDERGADQPRSGKKWGSLFARRRRPKRKPKSASVADSP